jgi:hypothetical protein
LHDVAQCETKIRPPDRFADHGLICVSLADESALLRSGADSRVVRKKR